MTRPATPVSIGAALTLAAVASIVTACAPAALPACRIDADCATGSCDVVSGSCVPPGDAGGGPSDAGDDIDAGEDIDAGPTTHDAGAPLGCVPDHDGQVSRDEVTFRAGLRATFRTATDVTVDLSGGADGGSWDLSGALAGDADALVQLLDPAGTWWTERYPDATYAAQLSSESELLGVFRATDAALLLLGVVSPEDGLFATRLTYDPPVTVLAFPVAAEGSWRTDATVSGLSLGVIAAYSEEYTSTVDGRGTLATPFGDFPVLRVRTDLDRTLGLSATTTRTFAFVAECFGTVATVTSQSNPSALEFSDAAEVKRLAP